MTGRAPLALLVAALLGAGAIGCGSSGDSGTSASHAARSTHGAPKRDRDNDGDNNDDDAHILYYGHAALGAERHELIALVTHYYAASAHGDGARACRLLVPFVAESIVEDYGHTPGLQGRTCATVMSKFFAQRRHELVARNATLKFLVVRIRGEVALTVLSFSVLPEVRQLVERRAGGHWGVLSLFDGIIE